MGWHVVEERLRMTESMSQCYVILYQTAELLNMHRELN